MADTIWFDMRPGDRANPLPEEELGEPAVLFHGGVPDWVRIPDDCPRHGGLRARVVDHRVDACPKCSGPGALHLATERAGLHVAGCRACGWVTYEVTRG